jgi:hypothetical protein
VTHNAIIAAATYTDACARARFESVKSSSLPYLKIAGQRLGTAEPLVFRQTVQNVSSRDQMRMENGEARRT